MSNLQVVEGCPVEASPKGEKTPGDISETGVPVVDSEAVKESADIIEAEENDDDEGKFGFWQACAFNTMMMFGTGPFITIPYCIAGVDPAGPHALVGYGVALVACVCDSLVCGEIGSMWPYSGGSATYLKHLYGKDGLGQLMAFMFLFQFMVAGPAEVASGFIAIAEYLVYFDPDVIEYGQRVAISLIALAFSTFLLYRNVKEIGWASVTLAAITIAAVFLSIVFGFANWNSAYLEAPPGALSGSKWLMSIAAATRFGVYDMTGYYDVCFMGDEVKNPKRTIPLSCIATCCVIGCIYLVVYLAVLGHLDWKQFFHMYTDDYEGVQVGIMSIFWESIANRGVAKFFTIVVCITIFGSVFSMMAGFQHLLASGARDGFFFEIFASRHATKDIPHVALLTLAGLSACWCFFSLDTVIDAMTTLLVFVQFMGQSLGLMYYRYTVPAEEQPEGWRMPLFPVPAVVQFILFGFIWITSPSVLLYDEDPILELCVLFLACGVVLFMARAKTIQGWPFEAEKKAATEMKAVTEKPVAAANAI